MGPKFALYEISTGMGLKELSTNFALYYNSANVVYGKGFVSEFLAIGESFVDMDTEEIYKYKTDHRNLTVYENVGVDFNYEIL